MAFTLGETKPLADNTGLTGTPLTRWTGGQTIDGSDRLLKNLDFFHLPSLNIAGQRIKLYNCRGPGGASTNPPPGMGLVNVLDRRNQEITFERFLIKPSRAILAYGIFGHDFTALRCDISRTVDGFDLYHPDNAGGAPTRVKLLGSYVHGLAYQSPFSGHADNQTHNDCVQFHQSIREVDLIGNNLQAFNDLAFSSAGAPKQAMSGLMLSPPGAELRDLLVERNWMDGGAVLINCAAWVAAGNFRIVGNRWGKGMRLGPDWTVLAKAALPIGMSGNYYADTLASYNGRKNG